MQSIKWQDKISNETIYRSTKQEHISKKDNLDSLGIVSEETRKNSLINNVLYAPKPRHCKRKKDRPKLLCPEYIVKLMNNEVQPSTDELRTEWSKFFVACKSRLFSDDDENEKYQKTCHKDL